MSGGSGTPAAPVCVLGRTDFTSGIGAITTAALELLSRSVPVSLYPTRESPESLGPFVTLPTGRRIPVVDRPDGHLVSFFTDVLWNGVADHNFRHVPESGFRLAHMAFDSDQLPPEWVRILNKRFDLALFTSAHLEEVASESGVEIPVGTLPIGLPIENLLSRRLTPPRPGRTRFGTISGFHHRKGLEVLIDAFVQTFAGSEDVELVLHSNFAIEESLNRIKSKMNSLAPARITVSHGDISDAEKDDLIDTFDVYVSASSGEGYSIGPREALALGKSLVLTDVPAHRDLGGVAGVFLVQASGRGPARYPEIDNRVFGSQMVFDVSAIGEALRRSHEFVHSADSASTTQVRRIRAAEFSLTRLESAYRRVIDPDAPDGGRIERSSFARIPEAGITIGRESAGRLGSKVRRRKIIIRCADAGFFSQFNVFASHLVWSLQDSSPPMVIPDWDVTRIAERLNGELPLSYCYSKPEDGNMWLGLFEPLYDLTAEEMNDPELLYDGAEFPEARFNEHREPLLTYKNAYDLYRAPWFLQFRRQYNRVVRDRIHLRQELQSEVDSFSESLRGRFMVAVHVKHPSHAVEQPNERIAGLDEFFHNVRSVLIARGIAESSDDWGVFVATDQDRVSHRFEEEFGNHVVRFDDVTRITPEMGAHYDSLGVEDKLSDGHQLQHQLATDPDRWSLRFAWEVWRDAEAMAGCDVLLHSVSNVVTAVSYLNDRLQMIHCDPAELS
jgi:glycosyltransferase involved in cell wall biosynthesis